LVLVGGGHAHVSVLAALAARPLAAEPLGAGVSVTLVSPYPRQIYSGMLPGWIAGYYSIDDCSIALDTLAQRAGVCFVQTACIGLNIGPGFEAGQVRCANGVDIPYDVLSLDTGPVSNLDDGGSAVTVSGAVEFGLPIRPIEGFVAAWPPVLERVRQAHAERRAFNLLVVGDGAAGIELAFAMQTRLAAEGLVGHEGQDKAQITVLGAGAEVLSGFPSNLRRHATQLLGRRGIAYRPQSRVVAVLSDRVRLACGAELAADASLLVTGAAAPRWPAASGLATDEQGFIRVGPTLQSLSHPNVFAAGDVAAYAEARPKSGVFAVRAGPLLAQNLRAYCLGEDSGKRGKRLQDWSPQQRALYLISTGQKEALAVWGGFSVHGTYLGRWLWRWKDRIDRRFIARFGTGGHIDRSKGSMRRQQAR